MGGVLQHSCSDHFNLTVLHSARSVEVRKILADSVSAGERGRMEAVIDVELDCIDIGQAGHSGIGSADIAADTGLNAVIAGDGGISNSVMLAQIHEAHAVHSGDFTPECVLALGLVAEQTRHSLNLGYHGAVHKQRVSICFEFIERLQKFFFLPDSLIIQGFFQPVKVCAVFLGIGNLVIRVYQTCIISSPCLNLLLQWLMGYDVPIERPQKQKDNDAISDIVERLRTDEKFLLAVKKIYDFKPEKLDSFLYLLD